MKSIGIIVLNWQGWRDTLVCLDSLRSLVQKVPISLIVCDNGSSDDSFAQILNWAQQYYMSSQMAIFDLEKEARSEGLGVRGKDIEGVRSKEQGVMSLGGLGKTGNHSKFQEKWPSINSINNINTNHPLPFVLIQTGANLGFAGGNNVAIRYALSTQQYEYLWLLNNDTVVDANALSALYEYAALHPQFALLGSTVIDYYQRDRVQCAGGCRYWPLLTIFKPVFGGQPLSWVMQYNVLVPIRLDYVFGAAMFLRVASVQKVGLLNEEYFLFYEELDYSQRLKQQGYQIGWCQKSLVYHKGSASIGTVRENHQEKLQLANYYENLSTLKYTVNFYPRWLPLVMFSRFVGKSLALISRRDFYLFTPLFRAYRDFIAYHLEIFLKKFLKS